MGYNCRIFLFFSSVIIKLINFECHFSKNKSGKCLATLQWHEGQVYELQIVDNLLYSCSSDATIREWDLGVKFILYLFIYLFIHFRFYFFFLKKK